MLSEARKREKVANAFLAATMAASAAQSPKDFVRTGHIEAPGTALMQMWGKKRGEAERNLDHGAVVPRNRKMKRKTFEEFIFEAKKCWPGYKKKGTQKLFGKTYNRCVKEGKVPWDDPKYPLQSGWTPAEKNRAKRARTGVEDPNTPQYKISDKDMSRYGSMKDVDTTETEKAPKGKKTLFGKKPPEHKNLHKFKKFPIRSDKGEEQTLGNARRSRGTPKPDATDEKSNMYQSPIKKGDKRTRGGRLDQWKGPNPRNEEYELEEGKVEWDNPRRPLQSGLTPREKNRAKRISTNVENPDRVSFGGKSWDISDKDYERYGKLKMAHDDEKDKKVPRGKRHEFGLFKVGSLTSTAPKGELRRQQKDHKNIKQKINSKLYKDDERQKVYHHNDLKEPKESFEYELEESSTGERSGRRTRGKVTLARGRGADMTRQERTTAAVAKKAGLKGTGKYSTKDLRTKAKDYTTYDSEDTEDDYGSTEQDHYIRTHSSARKAAKSERLISKYKPAGRTATGMTKHKTAPSSESVRRVKDLRRQMTKSGANKRGSVHTVDIMHRDSNVGKGDRHQQMERGRNFIQALKDTPKHLKAAGAKKGDTVTGKPTAVMDGEDKKTGEAKRAKLYKKAFGKRSTERSAKTGLMVGKVDEAFKQMPGELMSKQMLKLQKSQSDLRKGRQTKKKRDREIKYDMQMKAIQMAGKQDYNEKGESYGKFYQDPLKTGKIRNHRFR